jgi:hypothetical protein
MRSGQVALIRTEQNTLKGDYKHIYGNIKLDAHRDQDTGYFRLLMKACYRAGKDNKGPGVHDCLRGLLTDQITNKDSLGKVTDRLERARVQPGRLSSAVGNILGEIDQQSKLILHRESETPEEGEARSKICELLSNAMPDIGRIKFDLEEIEQSYLGVRIY